MSPNKVAPSPSAGAPAGGSSTPSSSSSSSTTPMVMITQSLGGISYSLRKSPEKTWTQTILSMTTNFISIPIITPFYVALGILFTIKPLQEKVLSFVLPCIMDTVGREFQVERSTLLEKVSGRVLDIGSGGGAYLDYCQNANEVVAVEPVTSLHPIITKRGIKNSLQSLKIVTSLDDLLLGSTKEEYDGEELSSSLHCSNSNNHFDWIILGNVLCEVSCVTTTLHQVHELLKPGGYVYFSEHIGSPIGTWQRYIQNIINPFWKHISGGCNCNHDSLQAIYNMQKKEKEEEEQEQNNNDNQQHKWNVISWMYPHMSVGLGPFVLGLAQKRTMNHHKN